MNAAELMDKVFDVYKRSFWKQLAYAAVAGVAAMAAVFVLAFAIGIVAGVVFSTTTAGEVAVVGVTAVILAVLGFGLALQAVLTTGAILLSREAFMGRFIQLPKKELLRAILRAFTALLAQAILLAPYIAAAVALVYGYVRFAPYVDFLFYSRLYYVLLIALLAVLTVGFLLLLHLFSLAIAVAVTEPVAFFRAVVRSVRLLQGDYWRLFGVRIIWFIIIFLLSFSAQGVVLLVPMLAGTLFAGSIGGTVLMLGLGMVLNIVSIVVTFALMPLEGILTAVLFFNQRVKKEGMDMEIAIEDLYRAV